MLIVQGSAMNTINPASSRLVQQSFSRTAAYHYEISDLIYQKLLETYPELAHHVHNMPERHPNLHLMRHIALIVANLTSDNLPDVVARLKQTIWWRVTEGRRKERFIDAIIWGFQLHPGSNMKPHIRDAWQDVWGAIVQDIDTGSIA